jgi:hypothetical protein
VATRLWRVSRLDRIDKSIERSIDLVRCDDGGNRENEWIVDEEPDTDTEDTCDYPPEHLPSLKT